MDYLGHEDIGLNEKLDRLKTVPNIPGRDQFVTDWIIDTLVKATKSNNMEILENLELWNLLKNILTRYSLNVPFYPSLNASPSTSTSFCKKYYAIDKDQYDSDNIGEIYISQSLLPIISKVLKGKIEKKNVIFSIIELLSREFYDSLGDNPNHFMDLIKAFPNSPSIIMLVEQYLKSLPSKRIYQLMVENHLLSEANETLLMCMFNKEAIEELIFSFLSNFPSEYRPIDNEDNTINSREILSPLKSYHRILFGWIIENHSLNHSKTTIILNLLLNQVNRQKPMDRKIVFNMFYLSCHLLNGNIDPSLLDTLALTKAYQLRNDDIFKSQTKFIESFLFQLDTNIDGDKRENKDEIENIEINNKKKLKESRKNLIESLANLNFGIILENAPQIFKSINGKLVFSLVKYYSHARIMNKWFSDVMNYYSGDLLEEEQKGLEEHGNDENNNKTFLSSIDEYIVKIPERIVEEICRLLLDHHSPSTSLLEIANFNRIRTRLILVILKSPHALKNELLNSIDLSKENLIKKKRKKIHINQNNNSLWELMLIMTRENVRILEIEEILNEYKENENLNHYYYFISLLLSREISSKSRLNLAFLKGKIQFTKYKLENYYFQIQNNENYPIPCLNLDKFTVKEFKVIGNDKELKRLMMEIISLLSSSIPFDFWYEKLIKYVAKCSPQYASYIPTKFSKSIIKYFTRYYHLHSDPNTIIELMERLEKCWKIGKKILEPFLIDEKNVKKKQKQIENEKFSREAMKKLIYSYMKYLKRKYYSNDELPIFCENNVELFAPIAIKVPNYAIEYMKHVGKLNNLEEIKEFVEISKGIILEFKIKDGESCILNALKRIESCNLEISKLIYCSLGLEKSSKRFSILFKDILSVDDSNPFSSSFSLFKDHDENYRNYQCDLVSKSIELLKEKDTLKVLDLLAKRDDHVMTRIFENLFSSNDFLKFQIINKIKEKMQKNCKENEKGEKEKLRKNHDYNMESLLIKALGLTGVIWTVDDYRIIIMNYCTFSLKIINTLMEFSSNHLLMIMESLLMPVLIKKFMENIENNLDLSSKIILQMQSNELISSSCLYPIVIICIRKRLLGNDFIKMAVIKLLGELRKEKMLHTVIKSCQNDEEREHLKALMSILAIQDCQMA